MISNNLNFLNTKDIYSLLLFALFKMRDIPQFSALSELAYVLDEPNLLKLCEYFGGLTIKVPTIDELELLVYTLLIYNDVNIENKDFTKVLNELPENMQCRRSELKQSYVQLCEVLKNYEFSSRKTD